MQHSEINCAILSGGTVSSLASCIGMRLAGVFTDQNFSGASMTLQVQDKTGRFMGKPATASGGTFTLTIASKGFAAVPKDIGAPIENVQFVSDTTQGATPSNLKAVFVDI